MRVTVEISGHKFSVYKQGDFQHYPPNKTDIVVDKEGAYRYEEGYWRSFTIDKKVLLTLQQAVGLNISYLSDSEAVNKYDGFIKNLKV